MKKFPARQKWKCPNRKSCDHQITFLAKRLPPMCPTCRCRMEPISDVEYIPPRPILDESAADKKSEKGEMAKSKKKTNPLLLSPAYPVMIVQERRGGSFVVTCRDFPDIIKQGKNISEALYQASGAIDDEIACLMLNNLRDIPHPSRVRQGERLVEPQIRIALKLMIWRKIRADAYLHVDIAKKLGLHARGMQGLLNPKCKTKIDTLIEALDVVGLDVGVVFYDRAED